jgi:hypothetical protein
MIFFDVFMSITTLKFNQNTFLIKIFNYYKIFKITIKMESYLGIIDSKY